MDTGRATSTGTTRPLLGFRQRPGRLALLVFRLPLPLYRAGWGWLLGRVFLVLTHVGRRTGQPHDTAAMVPAEDRTTGEVVICSVWGPRTDWVRNLRAQPALMVRIGGQSYVPQHRFLSDEEAFVVGATFRPSAPNPGAHGQAGVRCGSAFGRRDVRVHQDSSVRRPSTFLG